MIVVSATALIVAGAVAPAAGRDRPFSTSNLILSRMLPAPEQYSGLAGRGITSIDGTFSTTQIERFTCTSSGDPSKGAVDISCNTTRYGQDFAPDNEIAIAVDPENADHLVAGSNDYYYRFNNTTGARQALVPTGFFTSFDGGKTWLDGQVPFGSGNGNGDPAPAFDAKHDVVLMAQLENVGGQGGPWVAAGDVSVSRSTDGGRTWKRPVRVFKGNGTGIGPANQAVFWDKEFMTVDNNPASDFYGRAYVTTTRFKNGPKGSYTDSPIFLSWSDDGGVSWSTPKEISGSNPDYCTYQETGPAGVCDEDQFSNPVVGSDGRLYVYFLNEQNEAEWEVPYDFDNQVMVVRSDDGGATFTDPVPVAQLEDGASDTPYSVIGRQTVWGHQIRWSSFGNLAVDPTDPDHVVAVWADRGTANPNATDTCIYDAPGTAPDYDPCGAGPGALLSVRMSESTDGGDTWSAPQAIATSGRHQWFPWAGFRSDGTLVAAWDQDTTEAPADTFWHVLWIEGDGVRALGPEEHVDVSLTHWAGQYTTAWPAICGPNGSPTAGKDCNAFHGDYTGLAVGPDDTVHVVWTGLNARATAPQIDFYTGALHEGYRQDAMYAKVPKD